MLNEKEGAISRTDLLHWHGIFRCEIDLYNSILVVRYSETSMREYMIFHFSIVTYQS